MSVRATAILGIASSSCPFLTNLQTAVARASSELVVPDDLKASLKKNKKALATFEGFSYSHRKEYIQWITAAKTDATRMKRLKTAIEWMEAGKSRHRKYANR
jgi:uncharacterized protein YdeI (YjbR/CyaY-like superfamily)